MTTVKMMSSSKGIVADTPVELILKSPFQPRIELNPMQELSCEEEMELPILVRKAKDGQHYELVDGEGRLERLKKLGAQVARCEVREMDDEAASVAILRINSERRPLEDVEKARWLSNHMKRFGKSLIQAAADANWDRGTASRLYELAKLKGWTATNDPKTDSRGAVDTINSRSAEERTKPLTQNKLMIINTLPREKREIVSMIVEQHRVSTADARVLVAKVRGGKTLSKRLTR
jgi:ParB/RepB/Spo0J family partition protein